MKSLVLIAILGCLSLHAEAEITIHFLGTGGPEITKDRQGVATLIEVPGNKFLFDAGRGVLQRMGESRINLPAVKNVFFTHLHSDHIEGLPSLWMTSWFITKRNAPMHFWGPPGTQKMIDGLHAFMAHDVVARVNPVVQPSGIRTMVTEVTKGIVFKDDKTRITAIPAEHGDGNPALGYLFEHQGRSILLTGDSTYTPTFGKMVKKVDITICNVYAPSLRYWRTSMSLMSLFQPWFVPFQRNWHRLNKQLSCSLKPGQKLGCLRTIFSTIQRQRTSKSASGRPASEDGFISPPTENM